VKLTIRRIGNSLGIIIPRTVLSAWGLGEGDCLEMDDRGIRPAPVAGLSHAALDELKRSIALAVVARFTPPAIRAQILANLHRWREGGSWVSAYDDWLRIARETDDGALYAAMLGPDEEAARLRQSMPFVGLLAREDVRRLYDEAAA
jgi:antitoxin component of MazEF toxin-antitoxin module